VLWPKYQATSLHRLACRARATKSAPRPAARFATTAGARRSLRHDGRRPPPRHQLDDDGAQNRICVCTRTRCSGYVPDENVSCLT